MKEENTRIYATFILRGKELDPMVVTERLGLVPSKSFKRGDRRTEIKKWPHGFWGLTSDGQIQSDDLTKHIDWLIKQLEPVKSGLLEMVNDKNIEAEISCFWISPGEHAGIILPPEILRQITNFGVRLSLDIYCDYESKNKRLP